MPLIDLNNDSVIKLSAKLEKLHRSAFPNAVRSTLNDTAFEMKKQIPSVAKQKFITRQPSFFKRFSIVDKAVGWDVEKMQSITGIDAGQDNEIAQNLVSQEFGGIVRGKKLIPHDEARISQNQTKRVSPKNRHNKVNIHDATPAFRAHRGTRKSKFIAAIMSTAKSGKNHMLLKTGSRGMVYEVTNIGQNIRTKQMNFKMKKLYSVRNNKNHNVSGTGFMLTSASIAAKKMEKFYEKNAEYQFNKALK